MSAKPPLVIGLSGSPRRNGSTAALLDAFLTGAAAAGGRTELYRLAEMAVAPCRACYSCRETGRCAVADDFAIIFDRIREARVVALATPVFFGGVTAQAKAMIDRCQVFWVALHRRGQSLVEPGERFGVLLSTKASPGEKNFSGAIGEAKAFFATILTPLAETALIPGVQEDLGIGVTGEDLARAGEMGERLVRRVLAKP